MLLRRGWRTAKVLVRRQAAIFVFGNRHEGMGGTVLEVQLMWQLQKKGCYRHKSWDRIIRQVFANITYWKRGRADHINAILNIKWLDHSVIRWPCRLILTYNLRIESNLPNNKIFESHSTSTRPTAVQDNEDNIEIFIFNFYINRFCDSVILVNYSI